MSATDQEYTQLLQEELDTSQKLGIPKELSTMKIMVEIVLHPYAHCVRAHCKYHTSPQDLWNTLMERKLRHLAPKSKIEPRAETIEEYKAKGGIIKKIDKNNKTILPSLATLLGEK